MKKILLESFAILHIGLLSALFWLSPTDVNGQCQCGANPDVDPSAYYHTYYAPPGLDGIIHNYSYSFQFPCIGNPLPLGGQYYYQIIFREKGTTEWQVSNGFAGMISDGPPFGNDLLISAGPMDFCKTYEVRTTCPECILGLGCTSEDQLDAYLADPNNTLHNVSRIFEVCYTPIIGQNINNLMVSSVNTNTNSITVNWDLFPFSANYKVAYRKKPNLTWIDLGNTMQNTFEITGLEACADYDVKVQGYVENCCGETKTSNFSVLTFKMSDCISNIKKVDYITGNSAHVMWGKVGTNQNPQDYLLEWWKTTSNIMSVITTDMEYTITNLEPNSNYHVKVTGNCGPNVCASPSQIANFKTNCELHEPNNTFQTATPIAFDADISNANIAPAGDVDYFKFTPATCQIEIKADHPDVADYFTFGMTTFEGDLPYVLYDHDFHEVPKTGSYIDGQGHPHTHLHFVKPGEDYYLAVSGMNGTWTDLDCYTVKVMPCVNCEDVTNHSIFGTDNIFHVPSTAYYQLNNYAYNIVWSLTGPAEFIPQAEQSFCQLEFYDAGTVILTATVTSCDGDVATFQKEITVSNECYIEGTYTNAFNGSGLTEGFNLIKKLNYTISLDIPPGIGFNVYLNSGTATWTIDGNNIIVNQVNSVATFRIVLIGGNCTGLDGVYTFIKWPVGPVGPVEWSVSPNPASNMLHITPTISSEVDPNTVPDNVDIRLFNQNSHLEISLQGSTKNANQLNLSNLVPGNYSLQLLYGEYWQQFNVVKQ